MKHTSTSINLGDYYILQSKGKKVMDAHLSSVKSMFDSERNVIHELVFNSLMQISENEPRFHATEVVNIFDHNLQKIESVVLEAKYHDDGYELKLGVRK